MEAVEDDAAPDEDADEPVEEPADEREVVFSVDPALDPDLSDLSDLSAVPDWSPDPDSDLSAEPDPFDWSARLSVR